MLGHLSRFLWIVTLVTFVTLNLKKVGGKGR